MKKPTIADLQAKLAELEKANNVNYERGLEYRKKAEAAEKEIKSVTAKFSDLKQRLQEALIANAELRGYVTRAQEDDIVREELVLTGEPEGQQQLVPKRKPKQFLPAPDYSRPSEIGGGCSGTYGYIDSGTNQPRHWISY